MPVLIVSPNGTITERSTLAVAVQEHATQPDPHVVNVLYKKMIVTTNMSQVPTTLIIPKEVELSFTNNAVYTVNSGQTLDMSLCEFQKPHYDCFVNNGGTIIFPEAGPGPLQNWSIKNLIAAGTAAIAGALNGLSAVFTGNVTALKFIGPLQGNADTATTATTATNAVNATGGGTVPTAPSGQRINGGQFATDGAGNGSVTFSPAFAGTPVLAATPIIGAGGVGTSVHITAISSTGATFQTRSGATAIPNITVDWIAIGAR